MEHRRHETRAFETDLQLRDPTWAQLNVLIGHWSEETLTGSSPDEGKRRFCFPGMVLSFVKDIALLQAKPRNGTGLSEMPASGGHEMCWSFYVAVGEALEAGDVGRLRLLWEVSNQVTVRLRLNPTVDQPGLDRFRMGDQLRISCLGSGVQSFFFLCVDLFSLPALSSESAASGAITTCLSCPKLVA